MHEDARDRVAAVAPVLGEDCCPRPVAAAAAGAPTTHDSRSLRTSGAFVWAQRVEVARGRRPKHESSAVTEQFQATRRT